jgi:hypothetical protein
MFAGEGQSPSAPHEAQAMMTYNNVVFHHLSNFYAPSALAAVIAVSIGFGIIATDIAFHLGFDIRLVRSPGWLQPLKALNRLAYFLMRMTSILYLGLLLYFVNIQGNDCAPFFDGLFAIWYTSVVCMDFIFIARAVSLWAWKLPIAIPIFALYLSYSILGAANIAHWGDAVQLPGTGFCGYVSQPPEAQPLRTRLNVYFALALTSDTTILVLTCIRLAGRSSGQLKSAWSSEKNAISKPRRISQQLLVQGFVLYGSLVVSKIGFILAYYLSDYRQSWNVMVFAMHITLNTVTAGILVRQTSDTVRKSQHQTSLSHNSLALRSGDHSCTSCQLRRMVEQAEVDLKRRKRADEVDMQEPESAASTPDKVDLELGQTYTPNTLAK